MSRPHLYSSPGPSLSPLLEERGKGGEIIDTHTHIFPDDLADRAVKGICESHQIKAYSSGKVADLHEQMQKYGITKALILGVATRPEQVHTITTYLLTTAKQHPAMVPIGALYPGFKDNVAIIRSARKKGLHGFKMHTFFQDFRLNDPIMDEVYDAISAEDLPIIFHAGMELPGESCRALPKDFLNLRKRFPRLRFVLAHLGGNLIHDLVETELAGTDMYFDTSYIAEYLPTEQFTRIVNKHGAEHVLFASDSPWGSIEKHLNYIMDSTLNNNQKEHILHTNAKFFFKIA